MGPDLAKRRPTIVSGLARGVDSIAHQDTTAAGGHAIGALGIDICYLKENKNVYSTPGLSLWRESSARSRRGWRWNFQKSCQSRS
jgi:hypothetical protein